MRSRRHIKGRDIDGLLLLDKPEGLSSNQTLQAVKRLFKARKAGHTGSLDPLATGLLPICLGEATKISTYLLGARKHYRVCAKLGIRTDSADAQGRVIDRREVPKLDKQVLENAMEPLRGDIEQLPPMYSALKHKGQRLYELARAGIEVERRARPVRIERFELLQKERDLLEFDIQCSSGTYIRTLVDDLGENLGCGAHVTVLRRLSVSPFETPRMYTLEELDHLMADSGIEALDSTLLQIDSALSHWPAIYLDGDMSYFIGQGQAVRVTFDPGNGKKVRLYDERKACFLGMGEILEDGWVSPKRLMKWAVTAG